MALWELFTKFFPKINFQQSQPDFIFTPSLRLYIAMTHTSTTLESYSTTFYFLEEKNVTLAFHFSAIEICFHFVLYLYYYFQCWLMFSQFVLMYKMYNGLNLTIKVPNYFERQYQWVRLNLYVQVCLDQVDSEILQDENNEPWNNSFHSSHNFM